MSDLYMQSEMTVPTTTEKDINCVASILGIPLKVAI